MIAYLLRPLNMRSSTRIVPKRILKDNLIKKEKEAKAEKGFIRSTNKKELMLKIT